MHLNNSSERLISFVELAQINKKAKLIFVGGNPYLSHKNILSEEDIAKIFFKNINFDHKKITFLSNSRNTIENFKELKFFLKESSYDNILLITSASI